MYHHCEEFLETMVALKQADYSKYQKKIRFYLKLNLLILDDFLLHTITDEREIKVLFEVMEKYSELSRCTIVCSQREPNSWISIILNDKVSANAILKRATKHYTVVIQPRNQLTIIGISGRPLCSAQRLQIVGLNGHLCHIRRTV